MARIVLTTDGMKSMERRVSARLNFLGGEGIKSFLDDMGKDAVKEIQRHVNGMTPGGYKPLSKDYRKWKIEKVGYAYPLMWLTGRMISSMFSTVYKTWFSPRWRIKIGFAGSHDDISNARLAQIHVNGEGNMPKRDFIVLPSSFGQKWTKKISEALRKAR